MPRLTLIVFGTTLIAALTAPIGAAAESRHASKADHVSASDRLRNANDSVRRSSAQPVWYSQHGGGL
jgi:hypothetical protein